jgi:O-antigen ligase
MTIATTTERSAAGYRDQQGLAWALMIIVALAPLPLGGNRPILWTIWSGATAIVASLYGLHLIVSGRDLAVPLRNLKGPLWAIAALCLYLLIQVLPIASAIGLGRIEAGGISLTATSISVTPGLTQLMLIRWLGYGLVFFMAAQIGANWFRALAFLHALYVVIVAYAVLGIALLGFFGDTLFGLEKWAYLGVATATFVNRNSYATFLAFGFAMGTALLVGSLMSNEGSVRRLRGDVALFLSGQGVLVATLLLSGSRMGLLAAIVSGIAILVLALWRRGEQGAGAVPLLLAAAFGGLVLLLLFGGRLIERLGGIGNDAEDRFELYRQSWRMIVSRPLTGYGGGSFEQAFQLFHAPPLSTDVVWDKAHSSYLTLAAELGLPMAAAIVMFVGAIGWNTAVLLRDRSAGQRVPLAVAGVVIVAALHSLVDFSLEIQANAYLFATILGLGFGYHQKASGDGGGNGPN